MTEYTVRLLNKEQNLDITIKCPDNQSILEIAEANNISLPYSCRAGSCSTCLGKLVSGTVKHSDQTFLEEAHLDEGFVLTCVACPTSDITIYTHEEGNLY